jgi:hypothetical protein
MMGVMGSGVPTGPFCCSEMRDVPVSFQPTQPSSPFARSWISPPAHCRCSLAVALAAGVLAAAWRAS